jgi:hypothetical protein
LQQLAGGDTEEPRQQDPRTRSLGRATAQCLLKATTRDFPKLDVFSR